jgi:hypothetical protein
MHNLTGNQLNRRAATILRGVRSRQVTPTSDAFRELAELTEVISDAPVKPVVIARMTIKRAVGDTTIIEVHEDANFSHFYRIYSQCGRRRSTKRLVIHANRNYGIQSYSAAHRIVPGFERLAEMWSARPHIESVKVRILQRRAYKRMISMSPDQLGLTHSSIGLPVTAGRS